jgi:hypothetical protein
MAIAAFSNTLTADEACGFVQLVVRSTWACGARRFLFESTKAAE